MTDRMEPMTDPEPHPGGLLAGYVDGELSSGEASLVDRHLSSCATCREEVEAARRARRALNAFPALDVPAGLTGSIVGRARRPVVRTPAFLWGAGAAAAAAAAALILFAVVHGGTGGGGALAASSGVRGPASPVPRSTVPIRISHTNYDPDKIQALAGSFASLHSREVLSGAPTALSPQSKVAAAPAEFAPVSSLTCLRRAGAPVGTDSILQLISARFRGTPAYIAVFTHRPGAGKRPNRLVIWVAARDGCALLHYASQPLGG